ncbi:carbohydrate ABC transporter permease [Guyparkeria sp.]|uniref:carbohydrate ABC transporter permease n=1 Tax=Guyparkeria sp. TaxID=2035736 RepID=UPI003970B825
MVGIDAQRRRFGLGRVVADIRRSNPVGYLFTLPYVVFFAVFIAYPLGFAFYLTVHNWNIVSPNKPFVGARNYEILFSDPLFWKALGNTAIFLAVHIPLQIVVALSLAVVLNQQIRGRGFFRTAYFLPYVTSGAIVSLIWLRLYADDGMLNQMLDSVGLSHVGWLSDPRVAMTSIAVMATWKNVGYYLMIFLASMQAIPVQLYEESYLNGANAWQRFRYITFPMLNPAFILVVILSTIGGFSLFVEPFVMTGGGPLDATLSLVLYLYQQAFQFLRMGYAATIGVMLALMIFLVTVIQRRFLEQEIGY